ncbi:MAG: threonine synthase [Acidimicrobiia bacterium]
MRGFLSHLECGNCSHIEDAEVLQTVCSECGGPLLVRYDLDNPEMPKLTEILTRAPGQFRFAEVLPAGAGSDSPTLGEGATPLIKAPAFGPNVWIKDESQNPTGSFKARGMAVAMVRNLELGATEFCLPSNGNAGSAAAAYAALLGVEVEIAVPANTPQTLIRESRAYGADVILVDGTIADAARDQRDRAAANGWFSLATLHEPYRVEGKKMMGYELFWEMGRLPDVVFYPTGGGTGLIGMVKAFDEMETLGWIDATRPRMVAVQIEGCAPIVKAFHEEADFAVPWEDPDFTAAYGLRVPAAIGDRLMLEGLRSTGGTGVTVTEADMLEATSRLATQGGVWGSPEGGAVLSAFEQLRGSGWISEEETVVLFNTGSALKYL